jgi:hypothetical protein
MSENRLQTYANSLHTLEQRYAGLAPTPERPLTIPALLEKTTDENFISDYLAYILDPKRNGMGSAPLLSLIRSVPEYAAYCPANVDQVEVRREYSLRPYGRIDLLIQIGNEYVVAIEHKTYSPEGHNQTTSYVTSIKEQFEGFKCFFLYLTPDGRKAGASEFQPCSYPQLCQALREIDYEWKSDDLRRLMWQDFLSHLEHYFAMIKTDLQLSEKAKLYIEHHQMIRDLQDAYRNDASRLLQHILAAVRQCMGNEGAAEAEWVFDFRESCFYQQIYKGLWKQSKQGLNVHYELWCNLNSFTGTEFQFMLDVEGQTQTAKRVYDLFDAEYRQTVHAEYQKHGIAYRPEARRDAIAWKTYPLQSDPLRVEEPFLRAVSEFAFLTPVIDSLVEKL